MAHSSNDVDEEPALSFPAPYYDKIMYVQGLKYISKLHHTAL
jgi:hypothetical protein